MEQQKKHRKVLRTAFTKAVKEIDDLLSRAETDERLMKVSLRSLQQKHDEMKLVDNKIYSFMLEGDVSEDDLLAEMEGSDGYDRRFNDVNIRCEEWFEPAYIATTKSEAEDEVNSTRTSGSNRQGRRKFKLPTLEIKKFDGSISDWLPFWSQFKKLHDDPDIDVSDKVEYLIQATVPGSRARQLVDSFPATGENYSKMIDSLRERFGREDLQIEVYVRELLKLIIRNATSDDKMELSLLYDKLETQLRTLETLNITSDKYSAMLFPLVESCFPPDLLRIWQRIPPTVAGSQDSLNPSGSTSLESRLRSLMLFLKNEIVNEQRVSLAADAFGFRPTTGNMNLGRRSNIQKRQPELPAPGIPTALGLANNCVKCIFCQNSHDSISCFKAQNLSFDEKRNILSNKGACFRCLKPGHQSRNCRGRLKCLVCTKSHVALMCPELSVNKRENKQTEPKEKKDTPLSADHVLANNTSTQVFLQTLRVKIEGPTGSRSARALIDTGSQKSYVLGSTAEDLGCVPKRQINIIHGLFGGKEFLQRHNCYDVKLSDGDYNCVFEALDQAVICTDVSSIFEGPWMEELNTLKIQLSDSQGTDPIEILIGSDIAGKLYTGKRYILACGLVAMETLLGWTLMGKIPSQDLNSSLGMTSISLFMKGAAISDLWELDALGITDPTGKRPHEESAQAARELFLQTVNVDSEGRYEVRLPWLDGHPALPSNHDLANRRLEKTVRKMRDEGYLQAYNQVFQEWLEEQIIEEVPEQQHASEAHYLPHRPVIKQGNSTTKIRPVFDASAKEKDRPSLNQCLEKGMNLIEFIPAILLRFRQNKIGVISDIRKAFLQISICESDRDFLRFLWIGAEGSPKIYRHRRVVFGVNSSPFLLGATIEYHLSKMPEKSAEDARYSKETILKLSKGFYVDNCVTSVSSQDEMDAFIKEASFVMSEGKFDLRGWEYTRQIQDDNPSNCTPVLGLTWDKSDDTLSIHRGNMDIGELLNTTVTKRFMLSLAQRIFDPMGFTCPTTLVPKLLLQRTWEKQLPWDASVDASMESIFRQWIQELPHLAAVKVPRWINAGPGEAEQWALHTFCDASKDAFSAVVFLRGIQDGKVFIRFLAAKSRVAPLRKLSIPRLELMAAVIAARLHNTVKQALDLEVESFFWTDSSTVLSWIRRNEEWATFVWNRVSEIRKTSSCGDWRHVPGNRNPADLPSRGCSAKHLLESRWWEGPDWLYEHPALWPQDNFNFNEEEVNQEKRKRLVVTLANNERDGMTLEDWHLTYFSQYRKTIRMVAWVFRFVNNARKTKDSSRGELTPEQVEKAELFVLKLVQHASFIGKIDGHSSGFDTFKDKHGLIRLKSRVSNRDEPSAFRFPILLPAKQPVVSNLIFQEHIRSCHVGVQGLMSILRETYWILGGRRAIKSAISRCVVCKRQRVKSFEEPAPPLPLDRVRDAVAFEITGVDFAGPLHMKSEVKAWISIFTCAIYRAVHFELCTSLSVINFMDALRRFVARRGRPKTIYSDNGTNFVGTNNAFSRLDFQKIAEYSTAERIKWRFNPPTASWWGGFWERLVGMLKQLLRKVLGRASLDYESLATVICDCESVINSRPLTYQSSDANELIALTPTMFLRDLVECGVPDFDIVNQTTLCRRLLHRHKIVEDLRRRFRNEYLGQLNLMSKKRGCRTVTVGEVVLVGNDQDKRVSWPLGRVIDVLPGKDGRVRLARVSTSKGQLLRPVQRLYPLECAETGEGLRECPAAEATPSTGKIDFSPRKRKCNHQESVANPEVINSRVPDSRKCFARSERRVRTPVRFKDYVLE